MTTPVIFRKWKNGNIIALFPTIPSDYAGLYCMSYEHIGQHSGAYYFGVLSHTKLAMPEEYADLLNELVTIGYNDFKVYKRQTSKMYDEFLQSVYESHKS